MKTSVPLNGSVPASYPVVCSSFNFMISRFDNLFLVQLFCLSSLSSGHPILSSGYQISSGHPIISSGHQNPSYGHPNLSFGHTNLSSGLCLTHVL